MPVVPRRVLITGVWNPLGARLALRPAADPAVEQVVVHRDVVRFPESGRTARSLHDLDLVHDELIERPGAFR